MALFKWPKKNNKKKSVKNGVEKTVQNLWRQLMHNNRSHKGKTRTFYPKYTANAEM